MIAIVYATTILLKRILNILEKKEANISTIKQICKYTSSCKIEDGLIFLIQFNLIKKQKISKDSLTNYYVINNKYKTRGIK